MDCCSNMEAIDTNILSLVQDGIQRFNPHQYNAGDVRRVLSKSHFTADDFGILFSPAALTCLEELAARAKIETRMHFGSSVSLFTPLYLANYCENHCTYCGFHRHNDIIRSVLSMEEIEDELDAIAATGLKDILLLTGESRRHSGIDYIGEAVKLASRKFSAVGLEIYPLNTEEYLFLHNCGADYVSVYQETYQRERYEQVHKSGPKRSFSFRFNSQERALLGGMRGVSFGSLLGLGDYNIDAMAACMHAFWVQKKYPHAEISFSVPRLKPYVQNESAEMLSFDDTASAPSVSPDKGGEFAAPLSPFSQSSSCCASVQPFSHIGEKELLHAMLAYRLCLPYAGITISTRERAAFRDNVIGLVANRMSAGVRVGVGGHSDEARAEKEVPQFEISDERSVLAVHAAILSKGLQPVYSDSIFL